MASSSKRKTTMAKLNRERGLVERRQQKEARKAARKRAAEDGQPLQGLSDLPPERPDEAAEAAARAYEESTKITKD